MSEHKQTSREAASAASGTLRSDDTGKDSKTAAASTLAQAGNARQTRDEAATAASKTLRDGRTSENSKSAAGSALSQSNKD
jgi:hypothetical protein